MTILTTTFRFIYDGTKQTKLNQIKKNKKKDLIGTPFFKGVFLNI